MSKLSIVGRTDADAYVHFDNATVVRGSAEQSALVLANSPPLSLPASSRQNGGRASLERRKLVPKVLKGTLPVTVTDRRLHDIDHFG